ncbi:hypothetical protein IQ273_14240 [Nodosilinea sp. LEGE 07298]|jgi:hypothetical protein|uniref:hypothetical protein n=1 Tax=Nodosilinea sp. LEGE 07298 TaxID=2777970 RepID=UPI001880B76C|nr:hypothetical protein [Nodosilinea sp. LEGE 07298]MBE9110576.1 hypothetical protein [Nodosilinea sp. LEGE 07298]
MNAATRTFSVYISDLVVELRDNGSHYSGEGRLVCSQRNYDSLFRFAKNMALNRAIPLRDYTRSAAQYQY